MQTDPVSFRLRWIAALALAAAAVFLVACGDDDEDSTSAGGGESGAPIAKPVQIDIAGQGSKAAFSVPGEIDAGLTELTLNNETRQPQDLQLILVEGNHAEEEVVKIFEEVGDGRPIPDWFLAGGGVGTTEPGQSRSVTQVLEPSTYYGFSTEGDQPVNAPIEVTGDGDGGELPAADATVSAFEYGFEAEGLTTGESKILFDNTGVQPHHVVAAPIVGDATIEDVEQFFKTEKGRPPVAFEQITSTAVIEGGTSQLADLDLAKPGRYAFLCFISDRQGGPPHVVKGMVSEVEVK